MCSFNLSDFVTVSSVSVCSNSISIPARLMFAGKTYKFLYFVFTMASSIVEVPLNTL